MSRIRFVLFIVLGLVLLAVVFLWVYTRSTADYIAVGMDYRGQGGDCVCGFRTLGLYASNGDLGVVYFSDLHGQGMLEPGVPIRPAEPARFIWRPEDERSIPRTTLNWFLKYSRFGISTYDGEEISMSQVSTYRGVLVRTWMVALWLGLMIGFMGWLLTRRRSFKGQFCATCSYDIRTQVQGQGGGRCPECGAPIPPAPTR